MEKLCAISYVKLQVYTHFSEAVKLYALAHMHTHTHTLCEHNVHLWVSLKYSAYYYIDWYLYVHVCFDKSE